MGKPARVPGIGTEATMAPLSYVQLVYLLYKKIGSVLLARNSLAEGVSPRQRDDRKVSYS